MATRIARLLVTSVGAATAVGMAAPAYAEPVDPYQHVAGATDDTFLRSIEKLGIDDPSGPEAVSLAKAACAHIQAGNSIREAIDGVRNASPGMPLLQGAHFVAVSRALYCPNTDDW